MTFTLGAAQIIFLTLMLIAVVLQGINHGKQREDKYNVWIALSSAAVEIALLWWGGFFG